MFIGGAHQNDDPEIRAPSIKGALRFWWRASQWGECLKQSQEDTHQALKLLHQQESILFGAANRDDKCGQGLFQLKLKAIATQGTENAWPKNNDAGAGFLGYGLDGTRKKPEHRTAIKQGHFTVCLGIRSKASDEQIQQLKHALTIWGLLGGLGSRARRGFGSIAIQTLNDRTLNKQTSDEQTFKFSSSDGYFAAIKTVIANIQLAPEMPIYTALNEAIAIAKAGQAQDPRRLMDRLGGQYREARKQAGKGMAKLPFGLPLSGNRGESDEKNRRGSPLLMHIHPIANEYIALVTFIPAHFHPDYPKGKQSDFYRPIHRFMDTLEKVYP